MAGLGLVGVTAGAGVVGVAVGAAVGGAVAVGVGDFARNLWHAHWGADIHQHGVAMGIADAVGDSAVKTGQDMADMAKHIWHIF